MAGELPDAAFPAVNPRDLEVNYDFCNTVKRITNVAERIND